MPLAFKASSTKGAFSGALILNNCSDLSRQKEVDLH